MATTSKTHPWRVRLLRDVVSKIGGTDLPQSAGVRMCRTKAAAEAFRAEIAAEHGADAVGPVYKAA